MLCWRAALLKLIATAVAVALIVLAVLSVLGPSYLASFPHIFTSKVVGPFLERLPYTLELIGVSFLIALIVAFGCAWVPFRILKPVVAAVALIFQCIPFFWLVIVMQLIFAMYGGFPTGGSSGTDQFDFVDRFRYLALPAGALSLFQFPSLVEYFNKHASAGRNLRGSATSILGGLGVHFARNLPDVITATTITELAFAWPGVGRLLFYSFVSNSSASFPAGILLFIGLLVLAVRFAADAFARSTNQGASNA